MVPLIESTYFVARFPASQVIVMVELSLNVIRVGRLMPSYWIEVVWPFRSMTEVRLLRPS